MAKPPARHGERGQGKPVRPQTGQVPHDALVRVDRRVKEILARQWSRCGRRVAPLGVSAARRLSRGRSRMPAMPADRAPAPACWQREFAAEPVIVGRVRRGVTAFARAHGASEDALDKLSLAVSEATTNAVIHAFVGRPPGRVSVIAEPGEGCMLVRILDDGRGMTPRADSPGLGLGLALIASMATRCDIRQGPSGRGTEVRMVFAAAGVSHRPQNGTPNSGLDAATRRRQLAKGTP